MVEYLSFKQRVLGSSPSTFSYFLFFKSKMTRTLKQANPPPPKGVGRDKFIL